MTYMEPMVAHRANSPDLALRALANPLFGVLAGDDGASMKKAACRIAAEIEEDLILQAWPTGSIYGSEAGLSERFGSCRVIVRESVRILESRGTARMRRGPNGGLLVLEPDGDQLIESILRYVGSFPDADVRQTSCVVLAKVGAALELDALHEDGVSPAMVAFFRGLSAAVSTGTSPLSRDVGSSPHPARSRAEQISRELVRDLSHVAMRTSRLGSEPDLCERYGADRNVLRQAIRVLEFEGIAVSVAGRGNGLMARTPDPAAVCRLISCYFTAKRVPTRDAMLLFKHVSAEAAALAALKATAWDLTRLATARRALFEDLDATAQSIHEAEESQFAIIADPIVDLLMRSTKSYSTWSIGDIRHPSRIDRVYRLETLRVMQAILDRDPRAAAAAQTRKVDALAQLY